MPYDQLSLVAELKGIVRFIEVEQPVGRLGPPEEVVDVVAFLAG